MRVEALVKMKFILCTNALRKWHTNPDVMMLSRISDFAGRYTNRTTSLVAALDDGEIVAITTIAA